MAMPRPEQARLTAEDVHKGRGPLRGTDTYLVEISRTVLAEFLAVALARVDPRAWIVDPRVMRFEAFDTGEGTVEITVTETEWPR